MSGLSFLFRNGSKSLLHRESRIDSLIKGLELHAKKDVPFESVNQAYEGMLLGLKTVSNTHRQKDNTLFEHLKIVEPNPKPIEVFQQLLRTKAKLAGRENQIITERLQTPRFEAPQPNDYTSFISLLSPNDSRAIDWKALMSKYQMMPFPAPLFIKPNDFERFLLKLKDDEGFSTYLPASSVQKVMEDLTAARMPMTAKELNHLLRMCLTSINPGQSMDKLYKFMRRQNQRDIASYCVFLNRAIDLDDREMIARILKDVDKATTLKPNRFFYGLLAKYASERKDLDLLLSIYESSCLSFLDVVHLDHLIKALAECGFASAAERVLRNIVLPLARRPESPSKSISEYLLFDRSRKLYNHRITLIESVSSEVKEKNLPLFLFRFQPLPSMFSCIIKAHGESSVNPEFGSEEAYHKSSNLMHLMLERDVPIHHFCWNNFFASFRRGAYHSVIDLSPWLVAFLDAKRRELLLMDAQSEVTGTFLKFTPELLANIFQSLYLVSSRDSDFKSMVNRIEKSVADTVKYVNCSEYKNSTFRKMARRDQLILEQLEQVKQYIQCDYSRK